MVKLYDLTSLCNNDPESSEENPFTVPVAMLLYRHEKLNFWCTNLTLSLQGGKKHEAARYKAARLHQNAAGKLHFFAGKGKTPSGKSAVLQSSHSISKKNI